MNKGRVRKGEEIRDFELKDTNGEVIALSDYKGKKSVYLVFNRGFS